MPTTTCNCCKASIEKHLAVTCSVCKKDYKHTCVGITQAEVRTINVKGKNLSWNCSTCNSIGNDIHSLKAVIIALQNEVRELKDNCSANNSTNFTFEEVIQEFEERQKRKNNVIIFGIAEQDSNLDKNSRSKEDVSAVSEIIGAVFPECSIPDGNMISRLGKFNASNQKPRPIRVQLNEKSVHSIINKFSAVKKINSNLKNISVSFDRTPKQLQHLNTLRSELETRRMAGENNLTIKFVRGQPKIISVN